MGIWLADKMRCGRQPCLVRFMIQVGPTSQKQLNGGLHIKLRLSTAYFSQKWSRIFHLVWLRIWIRLAVFLSELRTSLSAIYENLEWRHERLTALKNKYDPQSLFNGQCTSPLRCAIYLPLALYNISILPPSYDRSSFHCIAWTFLLDSYGRIEPHQTISEFLYAL